MTADHAFALLYVGSATVGFVVAGLVWWTHRQWSAPRYLALALASTSVWSLGSLATVLVPDADRGRLVAVVVLPAVALSIGAFFCLLSTVADRSWRPSAPVRAVLIAHPTVMLLLGATNDLHHLVLAPVRSSPDGTFEFTILFWVHTVVSYGLVGLGFVRAVRARRHAPALRNAQLTAVLVAGCLPGLTVAGEVGYMVVTRTVINDLSPVAFLVAGLIDAHAVLRAGALRVLPIARAQVLDRLSDLVVVLDESDHVLDLNQAARDLLVHLGVPLDGTVGGPRAALGPLGDVLQAGSGEHVLRTPAGDRVLDVRATSLTDRSRTVMGTVLVARDVTADVERRAELARANQTLQEHVDTIERLRAEVAEQAIRDATTGLHNRRHLDGVLADLTADLGAADAPVSVVMLDADHFKRVNDEHGHAVGDRLLAELARVMTLGARPGETVARYGGEEFVVVLPGTTADEAHRRAEDIRLRCGEVRVPVRGGGEIGVTMSAGLATSGTGRTTSGELLDAADVALYEAKRLGRSRTCAAPDPGPAVPAPRCEPAMEALPGAP